MPTPQDVRQQFLTTYDRVLANIVAGERRIEGILVRLPEDDLRVLLSELATPHGKENLEQRIRQAIGTLDVFPGATVFARTDAPST